MKKQLLFMVPALGLLTLGLPAQIETVQLPQIRQKPAGSLSTPDNGLPKETDDYKWDSGSWKLHRHSEITYDAEGDLFEEYIEFKDGPIYRYTYTGDDTFDAGYQEELVGANWVPVARWRSNYDRYGYEISYKDEDYQNGTWVVADEWEEDYEYDGLLIASMIMNRLDPQTKLLAPDYKMLYFYNAQTKLVDYDIFMDYANGTFTNKSKTSYTWTKDRQMGSAEMFNWTNNEWAQSNLMNFTYTGHDYVILWSMWNTPMKKYIAYFRETYQFDTRLNPTLIQNEFDADGSGNWMTLGGMKFFNSYDAANRLVEKIMQEYKLNGQSVKTSNWVNSTKTVYYNFLNLGKPDPSSLGIRLEIYPNPAQGQTVTLSGLPGTVSYTLEVYSLDGRLMISEIIPEGRWQYAMDISPFATGSYLVLLKDKSAVAARQLMIKN